MPEPNLVPFSVHLTKFDSTQYIKQKTLHLVQKAKYSQNKNFDPAPFIQLLEQEHDELAKLKKFCYRKIGDLEDLSMAAQSSHKDRLGELVRKFMNAENGFDQLENRVSQVGNNAMLIGEQLEALDKQRMRGQEAKDLVQFFVEFNNGNSARLESIRHSDGWDGCAKAANIIKRLSAIAKEVDCQNAEKAREEIQKYYEMMEKDILFEFDQAYKDGNVRTMAKCASILNDFNGGQSCIQVFVNQHDFFTRHMHSLSPTLSNGSSSTYIRPLPKSLNEYLTPGDTLEKSFCVLYEEIKRMAPGEWKMIQEVFPNSFLVGQSFLQRLFGQTIQAAVENALRTAGNVSLLHYLDCLKRIHHETSKLTHELCTIFTFQLNESAAIHMNGILNRLQEDLFSAYIDNEKYLENEISCLQNAYSLVLKDFQTFQQSRRNIQKNKTMFSLISSASTTGVTDANTVNVSTVGISVELMKQILRVHRAALERCVELSNQADVPKNSSVLFSSLIDYIGKKYLEGWLDITIEDLLQFGELKSEPEVKFLSLVQNCNFCLHEFQQYFQSKIIPIVSSQPTVHRDLLIRKNEFVAVLETKVNLIIQKAIDISLIWLNQILSRQKKFDYRPKDSEVVTFAGMGSTPCTQACEYIQKFHYQLKQYFDGKNLDRILYEFSSLFHRALVENLKRFSINTNGGLLLTKDLVKYQETFGVFKINSINDRFEALRQLGNLYIVKPENLKTVIDEGIFSRMDPSVLHVFVMNRADYKQANLEKLFSIDQNPKEIQNKWEKTFEDAVGVVGDTFEEVGESLKKILFI